MRNPNTPPLLPEDVPHRWNSVRTPTRTFIRPTLSFEEGLRRAAEAEFAEQDFKNPAEAARRLLALEDHREKKSTVDG